ncbi:MAG: hypothetical protein V7K89_16180 [Nostoc sp.]|uniref:hypothetical protein n=1 Tax=Nostoc sp. TaxID=1180 RepID=UPI002FF6E979
MSQFLVQNAVPDLEENVGATEITLTEHELNRLEAVAPKNLAAGERYPRISHKLEGQRGKELVQELSPAPLHKRRI